MNHFFAYAGVVLIIAIVAWHVLSTGSAILSLIQG